MLPVAVLAIAMEGEGSSRSVSIRKVMRCCVAKTLVIMSVVVVLVGRRGERLCRLEKMKEGKIFSLSA